MQAPRVTNPRRLLIVGGLALALSLVLLISARGVIREVIVLPLSYLFWSLGVFVDTTPQIFFWMVLLLLAGIAAFRSLARRGMASMEAPPNLENRVSGGSLNGQVSFWFTKVNLLRQGQSKYFQNAFHQSVGRLLMDTLSYRYHLTPVEIEALLREGTLVVPEEVRAYALTSMRRQEFEQPRLFERYWSALVDLFRSWFAPAPRQPGEDGPLMASSRSAQDEQQVQLVLKYIEEELEVPHDDTGH